MEQYNFALSHNGAESTTLPRVLTRPGKMSYNLLLTRWGALEKNIFYNFSSTPFLFAIYLPKLKHSSHPLGTAFDDSTEFGRSFNVVGMFLINISMPIHPPIIIQEWWNGALSLMIIMMILDDDDDDENPVFACNATIHFIEEPNEWTHCWTS